MYACIRLPWQARGAARARPAAIRSAGGWPCSHLDERQVPDLLELLRERQVRALVQLVKGVGRRLIVQLSGSRAGVHEERVRPAGVAAGEEVALLGAELREGRQRGAVVEAAR